MSTIAHRVLHAKPRPGSRVTCPYCPRRLNRPLLPAPRQNPRTLLPECPQIPPQNPNRLSHPLSATDFPCVFFVVPDPRDPSPDLAFPPYGGRCVGPGHPFAPAGRRPFDDRGGGGDVCPCGRCAPKNQAGLDTSQAEAARGTRSTAPSPNLPIRPHRPIRPTGPRRPRSRPAVPLRLRPCRKFRYRPKNRPCDLHGASTHRDLFCGQD